MSSFTDEQEKTNPYTRLRQQQAAPPPPDEEEQAPENPYARLRSPNRWEPPPPPEPTPTLFDRAKALASRAREGIRRIQRDTEDVERAATAGLTGRRDRIPTPVAETAPEPADDAVLPAQGVPPATEASDAATPVQRDPGAPVEPAAPIPLPGRGWLAEIERRREARARVPGAPRPDPFGIRDPMTGELEYEGPGPQDPRAEDFSLLEEAARVFPRGVGMVQEGLGSLIQATDAIRYPQGRTLTGAPVNEAVPLIPGQRAVGRFIAAAGEQLTEQFAPSPSVQEDGALQLRNPNWWIAGGGDLAFTLGLSFATGGVSRGLGFGRVAQVAAFSTPTAVLEGGLAYKEAFDALVAQGMSEEEAHIGASGASFLTAAGAVALETLPGRFFLFNELPGMRTTFGRQLARRMASSRLAQVGAGFTTEAFEEISQEAWGDVVQRLVTQDPAAFEDWFERYAAAGIFGGLAGGVARGAQTLQRTRTHQETQETLAPFLDQLPQDVRADVEVALGLRPSSVQAAPTTEPSEADSADQPPPGTQERRTFRRWLAGVVDPSIYVDRQFGVQNRQAFQEAVERMDARPDLGAVILDVINLHGMNEILGSHAAADEAMRPMVEEVKRIHAELGGKARDLFRRDGDAFVAYVPRETENEFLVAVQDRIGLVPIGDSEFVTGFRAAAGRTSTEADEMLFQVKNQEMFRRYRDDGEVAPTEQVEQATEAPGAAETVAPPAGAPLSPELEALAEEASWLRLAGSSDALDQAAMQARIAQLSPNDREAVLRRSKEILDSRIDPLTGMRRALPAEMEPAVAPGEAVRAELGDEVWGRLEALVLRDDELGARARRTMRLTQEGELSAEQVVEDIARFEDELTALQEEPIALDVFARMWAEETGTEMPLVFTRWLPRRLFVEEHGIEGLFDPHERRAAIVNTAQAAELVRQRLEAGLDEDTQYPLTKPQQQALLDTLARLQGRFIELTEEFRAAYGNDEVNAEVRWAMDLEGLTAERFVDRVVRYAKAPKVKHFIDQMREWDDKKLTDRYEQYVRRWEKLRTKGDMSEAADQRVGHTNIGDKIAGTKATKSGMKARGNRSQQAARIVAAHTLLLSRGLPVRTEREIFADIRATDLHEWNRELFNALPNMSEHQLRSEWAWAMSERGKFANAIDQTLDERLYVLYQEFQRRGLDELEGGDVSPRSSFVREQGTAYTHEPNGVALMAGQWYSRVLRAIDEAAFRKPKSGGQWIAEIEKRSAEGVAKIEMEWQGFRQWLQDRHDTPLTRAEVFQAAQRTVPRFTEMMYGAPITERTGGTGLAEWVLHRQGDREWYALEEADGRSDYEVSAHPGGGYRVRLPPFGTGTIPVDLFRPTIEEAMELAERRREDSQNRPLPRGRYASYTYQRWGSNPASEYSEIVVQYTPSYLAEIGDLLAPALEERLAELDATTSRGELLPHEAYQDFAALRDYEDFATTLASSVSYTHAHWDRVENPLAHLRLTTRPVGGIEFRHIEEAQSDIHQGARNAKVPAVDPVVRLKAAAKTWREATEFLFGEGISINPNHRYFTLFRRYPSRGPGSTPNLHARYQIHPVTRDDGSTHYLVFDVHEARVMEEYADRESAEKKFWQAVGGRGELDFAQPTEEQGRAMREAMKALGVLQDRRLIDNAQRALFAPLKDTSEWAGLLVRRAFMDAAMRGKDGVSLTTGDQARAALGLRQQGIERVEWDPVREWVTAFNTAGETVGSQWVEPNQLDNYVGADLAKELRRQAKNPRWMVTVYGYGEQAGREVDEQTFDTRAEAEAFAAPFDPDLIHIGHAPAAVQGEQLEVGGLGNRVFYDEIMAGVFEKEARRWGMQVERVQLVEPVQSSENEWGDWTLEPIEVPSDLSDAGIERIRRDLSEARSEGDDAGVDFDSVEVVLNLLEPRPEKTRVGWYTSLLRNSAYDIDVFTYILTFGADEKFIIYKPDDPIAPELAIEDTQEEAISAARRQSIEFDFYFQQSGANTEVELNLVARLTPEIRAAILNDGMPTVREHNRMAYGSEEAQLEAYDAMVKLSTDNAGRIELVRSVGSTAWVNLVGQRVNSPEDAALLVRPWRSKQVETAGFMLLARSGEVLGVEILSSGAIDYVAFARHQYEKIAQRAVDLGAEDIIMWHNHPSGNPTPSTDDLMMLDGLSDFMKGRGLTVEGLIINDTTAVSYDTYRKRTTRLDLEGALDPSEPSPEERVFIGNPEDALKLVKHLDPDRRGSFATLYLDTGQRVVAVEPRAAEDVAGVAEWLPERQAIYGAKWAMFVVGPRDTQVYEDLLSTAVLAGLPGHQVLDIVQDTGRPGRPVVGRDDELWREGAGLGRHMKQNLVKTAKFMKPPRDAAPPVARPPEVDSPPADLFGGQVEQRVEQADALGPAPTDTLSSARATVSRLEGRIQRGQASRSELERYNQARALLRNDQGRGLDEQEVQARMEAEALPDDNLDLFRERRSVDPAERSAAERLRAEIDALEAQLEALAEQDTDEAAEQYDRIDDEIDQLRPRLEIAEAIERGDPERAAELLWGTTDLPTGGIYLMPDGRFLDGSDANNGGEPGDRIMDHFQIATFFTPELAPADGNRFAYIVAFMRRGNVRWSQTADGTTVINFIEAPTPAQLRAMREAIPEDGLVFVVVNDRFGTPIAERQLEGPRALEMTVQQLVEQAADAQVEVVQDPDQEGDIEEETLEGDAYMELQGFDEAPVAVNIQLPPSLIGFDQLVAPHLPGRLERPAEPLPGQPVSSAQVINALAKVTEAAGRLIPIRWGRLGTRRALGVFKVRPEVIRVLVANDIPTAVHELAHAIEKIVWGWPKGGPWTAKVAGVNRTMQQELVAMGEALYGDQKPAGGYKREGWAEFLRAYVTQEEKTLAMAPAFREWFEWTFLAEHPAIRDALLEAQTTSARYQAQGAYERVRQNMEDPAGFPARWKRTKRVLRRAFSFEKWIDMAQPLHRLSKEVQDRTRGRLRPKDDPYQLVTALRTTQSARVKRMVEDNMIDLAGNAVGPSLNEVKAFVKPGQYEDFAIYLWAKRAIALLTDPKGPRNPGMTLVDAMQVVTELETPAFERAASIVYDWNAGVLNYAAQASPVFAEVVKAVRARDPGSYVPLQRVFDDLDTAWSQTPKGAAANQKSPVKRLKGSGRRVKDPIQAMISQAETMVRAAHNRAVIDAIVNIAQLPGLGYLIEEVPRDLIPQAQRNAVQVLEDLQRALRREGSKVDVVPLVDTEKGPFIPDMSSIEEELQDIVITFFGPKLDPDNRDPIVPVYVNGKGIVWYQVDEMLFDTLSSMDVYRLPTIAGIPALEATLGLATNVFRAGTTGLRANFGLLWNPLRDFQTLYVNTRSSRNSAQLFGAYLKALTSAALYRTTGTVANPYLKAFLDLGGEMALPLGQDMSHTRRAARRIVQGRVVRTMDPRNWFDWYRDFIQFPEYAPRVAELEMVAKDIGWEPGMPMTLDQSVALLTAAKQVTTDFTAAGELSRAINRMVPFHNASIQGPRANVRALLLGADERAEAAGRPRDRKLRDLATARLMWRGLILAQLSLLLWWRNKDEDWWEELDPVERATHWWFSVRVGDREELVRIPRAFEMGMTFSALPEALAEAAYHERPAEFGQWMETFLKVSSPPMTPQPMQVAAEQLANRQFYWDRPIVPMSEQRLPAGEQFNEYTSIAARGIAEALSGLPGVPELSPRRIDHAIQGMFGPVARDLIEVVGLGGEGFNRGGREAEPSDIAILGRLFYRGGPSGPDESVNRLYETLRDAEMKQASLRHIETPQERERRLMMQDAARAVTAISLVQRATDDVDARRTLMELRRSIAKAAVEASPAARPRFTQMRNQWERQGERVQQLQDRATGGM